MKKLEEFALGNEETLLKKTEMKQTGSQFGLNSEKYRNIWPGEIKKKLLKLSRLVWKVNVI